MLKIAITGSNISADEDFSSSICYIDVSVGQPYHDGDAFFQTIDKIDQMGFKECIFVVADTLQRHTIMIRNPEMSEEIARERALEEGSAWLVRNRPYLKKLGTRNTIVRWDEWLSNPRYDEKKATIRQKYADDEVFKSTISTVSTKFIAGLLAVEQKKGKKTPSQSIDRRLYDMARSLPLCQEYVLEELAVIATWRSEEPEATLITGRSFLVYPFSHSPANKDIRDCLNYLLKDLELLDIQIEKPLKKQKELKPVVTQARSARQSLEGAPKIPAEKAKAIKKIERMLFENLHTLITLSALSLDEDAQLVLLLDIERQARDMQSRIAEKKAVRVAATLSLSTENTENTEKEPTKSIYNMAASLQDIDAHTDDESLTSSQEGDAGVLKSTDNVSDTSSSTPSSPEHGCKKDGETAERRHSDPGDRTTPSSPRSDSFEGTNTLFKTAKVEPTGSANQYVLK
ncbi:MAG: hypothetical protein KBD83_07710 [Gammaproteobacteria bacterium]|nr:hypothetical protein [Gammaproteobacteria bacterium]